MSTYDTPFGPVQYSNVPSQAREISKRLSIYSAPKFSRRHAVIKAQANAVASFRAAEKRYGKRFAAQSGWNPKRAKARPIELTGIGWRDYDVQYHLWQSDSSRYAAPWVSAHVQGLAIDVSQAQANLDIIHEVLYACGWRRVREDEPWHYSLGVVA